MNISGIDRDISAGSHRGIDNEAAVAKVIYKLHNNTANIFPVLWTDMRESQAINHSFSSIDLLNTIKARYEYFGSPWYADAGGDYYGLVVENIFIQSGQLPRTECYLYYIDFTWI